MKISLKAKIWLGRGLLFIFCVFIISAFFEDYGKIFVPKAPPLDLKSYPDGKKPDKGYKIEVGSELTFSKSIGSERITWIFKNDGEYLHEKEEKGFILINRLFTGQRLLRQYDIHQLGFYVTYHSDNENYLVGFVRIHPNGDVFYYLWNDLIKYR